ncbi:zf-HC2 domain-containing protein [Streptomyces sp. NBC_01102]|uniref:anti-sigma factor family protein n=1 Tax=Streptomyces sp. NBC_01102 TaxID=2903749 RepID=UPI00386DF44F|nr:zf-HC2 domain-containing protein [Streptomyces sp. NBC_01102]
MSGTGPTPAEQHLGDRLAALVDGELKHDARERVLAHLATCSRCKAEADAQRRLKSAFATATPPSPSEGFLARLQGLPGGPGGDGDSSGGPFGGGRRFGEGLFPDLPPPGHGTEPGTGPSPLDGFGYLPTAHGSTAVLPGGPSSAFRIHAVGREADRSPWRARRFAFAAASAVSLAAIALGGALPLQYGPDAPLSAEGAGSSGTPPDTEARTASAAASRGGGGALAVGERPGAPSAAPFAAPSSSAQPVLAAAPSLISTTALTGHTFAFPVLNVSVPPLIRPTDAGPLLTAALGGGEKPKQAEPSATASTPPALRDRAMPLSPLR